MKRAYSLVILLVISFATTAGAFEDIERRRDQFGKDFGYYVYPLASTIPGLGTAEGAGATVLNIGGTDTDFTGFKLVGDFKASGYALLDLHAIPRRLIFDVGYYDFEVAPVVYNRGINSAHDDYILPKVRGSYEIVQATASFWDRMFEAYVRELQGSSRLLNVSDKNGNAFDTFDTNRHDAQVHTVGAIIDYTDDRLDPRKGIRLEAAAKFPVIDDPNLSKYYVTDFNLTGYVPFRSWDTLVLNLFHSDAHVTRKASTDFAELQQQIGLGCGQIPAGPGRDQCLATEASQINERIAENQHGTATSLGGTQRLAFIRRQPLLRGPHDLLRHGVPPEPDRRTHAVQHHHRERDPYRHPARVLRGAGNGFRFLVGPMEKHENLVRDGTAHRTVRSDHQG